MPDLDVAEAYVPLWTGKNPTTGERIEHYAYHGGRGGGKSHGIAEAIAGLSCQREERVVCGRQYQNSIRDSVKELLEKKIYAMNMAAFFKSTERELINTSTGSRFSFIGMDRNPDSAKSLEGATIFWGEEAQTFTPRSVEIIIPTIRDPRSRMVWSWNPRFRTDAVDDLFRGPVPPERSFICEVNFENNPWFYRTRMPSEMRRSLRRNPKRHVHIWRGGYDENPDTAIFPSWRIGRVHVPDKARPKFGLDFGFGSDPNALIKLYLIEELDIIYIAAESVGYKVPNQKLPDLLDAVEGSRDWPLIGDSARPETIDYLNSKGFNVYGARKGAGSVKNGLNFMAGYELVINPECLNTIEEVRTYRWATDPMGKPLPMPEKDQNDHCIDAARYALEEDSTFAPDDEGGVDYV